MESHLSLDACSSGQESSMVYQLDYKNAEKMGCSAQITIADRIFYVKLFSVGSAQYFSADQQGILEKEISQAEFEMWMGILADNEAEATEALGKLGEGKKY